MLVALGAAALVWALGGEWVSISHGIQESHLLDAMVGLSFFGAGIVALDRRPRNVIGPLMVAFAAAWFLGNWSNLVPVFPTLAFVAGQFQAPLLVHIALAYPTGRLRTRFDRVVLGTFYAAATAVGVGGVLTFPRRPPGCGCPWAPLFVPNRTVFDAVNRFNDRSAMVLVPLFLAAGWLRWRRASQGERRELAPWWAAASILAGVYLLGAFASPDSQDGFSYLLWELRSPLQISAPIVFVWGLLQSRLPAVRSATWWSCWTARCRPVGCRRRWRRPSPIPRWRSSTPSTAGAAGRMPTDSRSHCTRRAPGMATGWPPSSNGAGGRWRRCCTTRRSTRDWSAPPAPRRAWRSRTSASTPRSAPNWTRCAPRGPGSCRPVTRSVGGSSGTCTTARSSAC
jgi:hypothetical protein